MNPQQPYYQPASTGNPPGPYDFITNPPSPPKKSLFSFLNGGNKTQRILIACCGLVILFMVLFIAYSMLFSNKGAADQIIELAQQQTELIRLSTIGTTKARTADGQNLAETTELSLITARKQTLKYLKDQGVSVSDKELAATKDTSSDKTLSDADQNSRFDDAFIQMINQKLADYQSAVKKVYDSSSTNAEKQILSYDYRQAGIILASK